MDYRENYKKWLSSPALDEESKRELEGITDEGELSLRFSSYMEFGTGGLRARMGAGSNMMNVYTVAHATEGVARLIDSLGEDARNRGVVIGRDSRHNSDIFARRAAEILSAHGIKTYLYDDIRPTPELSFGVRYFGCIAGINITASHNPSAYNGYKLYWEDGAQPTKEKADLVCSYIETADIFEDVPTPDKAREELIISVGDEVDREFLKCVEGEAVCPEVVKKAADKLKVVYTPLYGAGAKHVPEIMRRIGLKYIYPVEEQMKADGSFPGLSKPNPEYPASFELGIALAEKVGSDLIIATDPDADRVGVMARGKSGRFECLTGNQVGYLMLDYIITALKENGRLPEKAFAVKTIVSGEMATVICQRNGVEMDSVLTGFKFIAEDIEKREAEGGHYLLGFEESYGYMKGGYTRDKDSVAASMLICEMAAYYSLKNMTLIDALDGIFKKYGYYSEQSAEIYMEGADGKEKISAMMEILRNSTPETLAGERVVNVRDYRAGTSKNILTGTTEPTGLPESNVMYFMTEKGNVVVARPSGTEPKIKFYILAHGDTKEMSDRVSAECKSSLEALLGLPEGSLKK